MLSDYFLLTPNSPPSFSRVVFVVSRRPRLRCTLRCTLLLAQALLPSSRKGLRSTRSLTQGAAKHLLLKRSQLPSILCVAPSPFPSPFLRPPYWLFFHFQATPLSLAFPFPYFLLPLSLSFLYDDTPTPQLLVFSLPTLPCGWLLPSSRKGLSCVALSSALRVARCA
jgi:hypothetical protein